MSTSDGPHLAADAFGWFARGYECRTANDLEGARDAFERAISGNYGRLPAFSRAGALRALGELAEARSDVDAAIAHYRAALAEDPKVGVQKRLGALERAAVNRRRR